MMTELTAAQFDAELTRPGRALLLFWAPWDAASAAVHTSLQQAAPAASTRLYALNIVSQQETAMRFELQQIPTIYLLRDGRIVRGLCGRDAAAQWQAWCDGND